jgi:hypothetical protein
MTAESPFHSVRLAAALAATRTTRRRRRRGGGVLSLMILLLAIAMLLSLAVMFLPLSHPHVPMGPEPGAPHSHQLHPPMIPSLG